jgi:hypothetical protein
MNMYTLIVCIIHGPFDNIMVSHYLQLDVGCDFTYVITAILIIYIVAIIL